MRASYIVSALITLFVFSGCSYHQKQNDLADNHFWQTTRHSDSDADYLGAWARETNKWTTVIKINENGMIKVYLHPHLGSCDGKLFVYKNTPSIVFKDGTKARIVNSSEEKTLELEVYGENERYTYLSWFNPKIIRRR